MIDSTRIVNKPIKRRRNSSSACELGGVIDETNPVKFFLWVVKQNRDRGERKAYIALQYCQLTALINKGGHKKKRGQNGT
ncbi:hypothetical protein VNO77_18087 [Canavalia gladiata]|uniref:Uncharacterized protein n=1 Tax=Canavalia gladiata TaxID=3824 RepID=A0AAN9LQ52_CANGL